MIILKNSKAEIEQQLKNAIAKCRNLETKPRVKMIQPGKYSVIGNQNQYTVKMRIDERNHKIIECNCRAGEEGMPCYHSAAALALHSGIIMAKAEVMNQMESR